MDAILNLLPGGGLTALLGGVAFIMTALGMALFGARQAGKDAEKAKEAKRRDQDLERIKRASSARPVGGVLDDLNNRDTRE